MDGMSTSTRPPLELWGGIECTVNRVGDRYFDQLERSGHAHRLDDLDRIAALGLRTVRYPILWERVAPDGIDSADWRWPDERMERMRGLGLTPIIGLVHHGSGPRDTSLLDDNFPRRLAEFAAAVARRYPWVEHFTPVNEPLTTARFSALYGHWYPHHRDPLAFAVAFLNQCEATREAMRAIREVTPSAWLVQTEDLGRVHATSPLRYQADFENERRWLTFDVLCGRFDAGHPMRRYFRWLGVPRGKLASWCDDPCPPDIIGINHYLTSDRFLDHRIERYPEWTYGGNGRHRYADVEAVRVAGVAAGGRPAVLREAWQRYGRAMAITETHLGCTREQQMRWLREAWEEAQALQSSGCDLRAVTAWSLFGAFDWNSLLTRDEGHYEAGAFDVRAPEPRSTALATAIADLARSGRCDRLPPGEPGWWRTASRFIYVSDRAPRATSTAPARTAVEKSHPLLLVGASGTLGRAVQLLCEERGLACVALSRPGIDVTDPRSVRAALERYQPWAVVNAAGYVRVDDAELDAERCRRVNTDGAAHLAEASARIGAPLLTFSSDLVFDGRLGRAYDERDAPSPLGVYGRSKADAERRVLAAHPRALVVRTSAFFGPWDDFNFATVLLRSLESGIPFRAAGDSTVSPTYVPDLVHASLDLLTDGASGIWHLANEGAFTWVEFARSIAAGAGLDASLIEECETVDLGAIAARPPNSSLTSVRARLMPTCENAICRYLASRDRASEQAVAAREDQHF